MLTDLLSMAESRTSEEELVIPILPPDNATGSVIDEDSGDEDGGGTINNLPGSMLRTPTALEDEYLRDEQHEPKKKKTKGDFGRKWIKKDIESKMPPFSGEDHNIETLKSKKLNPSQYFEMFFDESLVNIIVIETNRYAFQNNVDLQVTEEEIKCILGVLILSGYVSVPRRRMYWENLADTHHDLVANALRRNRFEAIFTHIHFADNNDLNKDNKFAKVRPLFDSLGKNFLKHAPLQEFYSVDESMCEYYGRHGCKQFIQAKPIRFGYKVWCGKTTLGNLVWFDFYQGKGNKKYKESTLGLGGDIVKNFAQKVVNHNIHAYHLCFDNYFTSVKTMAALKNMGVKGNGTVLDNRVEKYPLEKKEEMKKRKEECMTT